MGENGVAPATDLMRERGVDERAVMAFTRFFTMLEQQATGHILEDTIEPLGAVQALGDLDVSDEDAREALGATVVLKLNGGLGTSMGMDRAKSLLCVRRGLSFLDIIARQVLHLRQQYDAPLPLIFMNSFRTSADTMAALARYDDLQVDGLPLEFLQNKIPKLLARDLMPAAYPKNPDLEWCPPGHGDLYTALRGSGLLTQLRDAGYRHVFVSNSDNLGAVPDARVAGWFAQSGAPFAIEAVRRTASDRKGGHFATRKADGRIVLRETAQTLDSDKESLADLDRHRFTSTNNLWFDLEAMAQTLDARQGILGLPMIRNVKHLDPADKTTPEVIQIETAMGAAIEIFEGATTIEVGRDRFVPVKTTNDLLVLRSDIYDIGQDFVLDQTSEAIPFVDLDGDFYKLVGDFDKRFPEGAPSLKEATSLTVDGDVTFGHGVKVVGDVAITAPSAQRIDASAVLAADG